MKASANVLCPRTGLTSHMLFHPQGTFFTPSLLPHLFLPPRLCCLPNSSPCTLAWENHSRQGFWVSQIWRWGDVTWHTEGRRKRWGLQASHSWRLRQPPVGGRVGFSESPKGKHPDPEKEIGARRISREMLPCLRLWACWEKQQWEKKEDLWEPLIISLAKKLSITGKWHVGFFYVPKDNCSSGGYTYQQTQGQVNQQKAL